MKNPKLNSPSYCPRSSCFRHPSDPSTGICPSCLRDRLSGLDPSSDPPSNLHLPRSLSVSNPKDQPSCSYTEPRRASCDERNSLSDLLRSQDHKSRNVKLIDTYQDDEVHGDGDQGKTMKEFIDLEVGTNDRKSTNRNLFRASSIFRRRLRKSKDKQVPKKENVDRRRRSCDTEPRFSIDGLRGGGIEEGRASWDGYLVSRTIPSLAPMLYVVENGMLSGGGRLSVDGGMQAIMEDESSSGGSGVGNSDSLSSQRWSSFDRSSSVRSKKMVGVDSDEGMSVSSVKMSPTKLIVTERELRDWRLRSGKDDGSEMRKPVCGAIVPVGLSRDLNRSKKGPTWRKMFNVLGLKAKPPEKKSDKLRGISVDRILGEGCEKPWNGNQGELKDAPGFKTKVGGTFASARKSLDMVGLDHSMSNGIDPKVKPSEKKHDNLKGMSVDRILGEECEKQWSELQVKLKDASGRKVKVGGSIASARKSVDVVTLDRSTRDFVEQQDTSGWKLTRSGSVASSRSSIDFSALNQRLKSGDKVKESSNCRLARSGSVVSSRRSLDISSRNISERSGDAERRGDDFVLELNDNARKRTSKVDGEALPFYLMPLRSSRSGRHRS